MELGGAADTVLNNMDPSKLEKLNQRFTRSDSNSAMSNDTFDTASTQQSVGPTPSMPSEAASNKRKAAAAAAAAPVAPAAPPPGGEHPQGSNSSNEAKRSKRKQAEPQKKNAANAQKHRSKQTTLSFGGNSSPQQTAQLKSEPKPPRPASSPLRLKHDPNIGGGSEASSATEALQQQNQTLSEELERGKRRIQDLETDMQTMQHETASSASSAEGQKSQYTKALCSLLEEIALSDYDKARKSALAEKERLGYPTFERRGISIEEYWLNGSAYMELERRKVDLDRREQACETQKKKVSDTRAKLKKERSKDARASLDPGGAAFKAPMADKNEYRAEDVVIELNLATIKDERKALDGERQQVERDKVLLTRELKRIGDEDSSNYCWYKPGATDAAGKPLDGKIEVMNEQYALMSLLGKGGFSEVYKAYDLNSCTMVACKVHQLQSQWSQAKKDNYIKHATREYEIHKDLDHLNVTKLNDVFEIDEHSFCTVMEFCAGYDLDLMLKQHGTIQEKDAKCKIAQVVDALKYLNNRETPIIHYDLKPANILLVNGQVKLTDFGLSKQMDVDNGASQMELTSQGAGTYWYLPPETFMVSGNAPPQISSKVDVWSVGIIFFQILYGRRPFGHNMSQQSILQNQTILNAKRVEFPTGKDDPKVSAEAQEFIRRCLSYRVSERPDVLTLWDDPYLRKKKTTKK